MFYLKHKIVIPGLKKIKIRPEKIISLYGVKIMLSHTYYFDEENLRETEYYILTDLVSGFSMTSNIYDHILTDAEIKKEIKKQLKRIKRNVTSLPYVVEEWRTFQKYIWRRRGIEIDA